MKNILQIAFGLLTLCPPTFGHPRPNSALGDVLLRKKADASKAGYLAAFWQTESEELHLALSTNDNPITFQHLNGGNSIAASTVGTKAIRDVSVVPGGGSEAGKKWYIIATDLDIGSTTWNDSVRTGSRSLVVWDSTDLVTWGNLRLVEVEGETAGMAWAPDAVWDETQGAYFVTWSSNFYADGDTQHTGDPLGMIKVRYAYTSDFITFTEPADYIALGDYNVIDQAFLKLSDSEWVRFYSGGPEQGPVAEHSVSGLLGDWTNLGLIEANYEGPYGFWDNQVDGKAYLVMDLVGGSAGLRQWTSENPTAANAWTQDTSADNTYMRHGSVVPVTQDQYNALLGTYPV